VGNPRDHLGVEGAGVQQLSKQEKGVKSSEKSMKMRTAGEMIHDD